MSEASSETESIAYVTPRQAFRQIRRGSRIFIGSGAAAPLRLIEELDRQASQFVDHEVVSLLFLGPAPHVNPQHADRFRHNALFIGPNVRSAVETGHADYTPIFLSEIPAMFKSGQMHIDVAMIQVAPPENGFCALGVAVDVIKAAAETADLVIAEVNPQTVALNGDARIPVDRIDCFIEADYPLPELFPPPPTPTTDRIGANIAKLVEDGSIIQAGIGAIPNAALGQLTGKRDLGIHTEMMGDGFRALIESGAVNNSSKRNHRGKSVASFLLGSRTLYEFARGRTDIELYPCDYTNDPFVIGQNDRMVAINTAIEVDLTGQVCADSIGARFYSGIGGQVDFIRGAARSDGGKPIIALASTAKNGTVSRIKPRLQRGGGVVTTRGDVHYVVTEWGIASLHGKTIRERAMALIEIAHPRFRPWLLAEAKQYNYVYRDQVELPIHVATYPEELETFITDREGRRLLLRPVRPSDEEKLHDLFYGLSDQSMYQRFFVYRQSMPHASLQHLCNVDYSSALSLVVCSGTGDHEPIVALARYTRAPESDFAEAEFVVRDQWQGRGIGSVLVQRLAEIARARGVAGFTADVLTQNVAMLHLFRKLKGTMNSRDQDGVCSVRIEFPTRSTTDQASRSNAATGND